PETEAASADAKKRAAESIGHVIEALKAGENVVLWPSGTLARQGGIEHLGAARTAADVLDAVPDVTVVLLRTRGLSGSRFSWAYATRRTMIQEMLPGVRVRFANGLFFAPRRRMTTTLEAFPLAGRPSPAKRETINPWLQRWYNAAGPEEPTYVPYHFL